MIDRTHTGCPCHTTRLIRFVNGNIPPGTRGIVESEMENLGRHLILVKLDIGKVLMFPEDIEMENTVLDLKPNKRLDSG